MSELPKVVAKRMKRLGRGPGSGKGRHTVGRGQKGQKTRRSIGVLFEGYKVKKSLFKRLPMQRGRSKFKAYGKPVTVRLDALNVLKDGTIVDLEVLIKNGLVGEREARKYGVKILSGGKLTKKLEIKVPVSGKISV